ncbi:hypothetical protein B0T16DRAFT_410052 [Cercophora newfieldiana]|uniref:NACHT domain-containing protein n=1 Tax=Cercophora newfieldiana TaxID=92897 RepID=A0AA39YB79_9PEZI|nr:hypothetical protein B0T16DRAFT_410052 [Cercophora newfieldiana]
MLDAPVAPPDAGTLFTQARDTFLASLSAAERQNLSGCSDINEVLDRIASIASLSKAKKRIFPCLEKIKTFGDNMSTYFKVLEIFCGSHPEWANLALGSLFLVLQLSSNFVSFFEKLCDTVQQFGERMPRYQELYDAFASRPGAISGQLRRSLLCVYTHIFEFFTAVSRVFSKQCGRIKRTPQVIASLMWKPFDLRFQKILAYIKIHQEIVRDELQFASIAASQSTIRKDISQLEALIKAADGMADTHDQLSKTLISMQLMQWLQPPEYELDLEHAQQEKTECTMEWIWELPQLIEWKSENRNSQESSSSIFWIQGNPGSGKTVLASSIIAGLPSVDSARSSDYPVEVMYFFFNQTSHMRGTRNSLPNAYRALAAQLYHRFHHLEKVHNVFAMGTNRMATKLTPASVNELVEAISQCLPHLPNLFFVLDALDECEDSDKLLKQLRQWCDSSPLRVLLLSRPDLASLRRTIPAGSKMLLDRNFINGDIAMYLQPEIEIMCLEGLLPSYADVGSIVNHLVDRAEGMFLWARLMVNYISSQEALTRRQRMDMIMEPKSEGLDSLGDLYDRIANRIRSSTPRNKELAHKALLWIAHTCLDSLELREAIWPESRDPEDKDETGTEQFEHAVIITCCCGLVEKRQTGKFHYIHLTALEFARLGSTFSERPNGALIPGEGEAKVAIVARLLSYLAALPPRPLFGQLGGKAIRIPLGAAGLCFPFPAFHGFPLQSMRSSCQ